MNKPRSKHSILLIAGAVICMGIILCASGMMDPWINRSCVFYGQIVDSSGKPVEGVDIHAKWTRGTLVGDPIPLPILWASHPKAFIDDYAVSDSNGRFTLRRHAESLTIVSIEKGGWRNMYPTNAYGDELFKADPKKPVCVELWSPNEIALYRWQEKLEVYRTAHRDDSKGKPN